MTNWEKCLWAEKEVAKEISHNNQNTVLHTEIIFGKDIMVTYLDSDGYLNMFIYRLLLDTGDFTLTWQYNGGTNAMWTTADSVATTRP